MPALPNVKVTTEDIKKYAVGNEAWQKFRKSLKGLSTQQKLDKLSSWWSSHGKSKAATVQVMNYLNALKRGGQIKASDNITSYTLREVDSDYYVIRKER